MTDLELKLITRINEVIRYLEELHQDPRFCKGYHIGMCQAEECWIWRLLTLLKSP